MCQLKQNRSATDVTQRASTDSVLYETLCVCVVRLKRVKLELFLHVSLRHLSKCVLVLSEQFKDGSQLLLLNPTTQTQQHKEQSHTHGYLQSSSFTKALSPLKKGLTEGNWFETLSIIFCLEFLCVSVSEEMMTQQTLIKSGSLLILQKPLGWISHCQSHISLQNLIYIAITIMLTIIISCTAIMLIEMKWSKNILL